MVVSQSIGWKGKKVRQESKDKNYKREAVTYQRYIKQVHIVPSNVSIDVESDSVATVAAIIAVAAIFAAASFKSINNATYLANPTPNPTQEQ